MKWVKCTDDLPAYGEIVVVFPIDRLALCKLLHGECADIDSQVWISTEGEVMEKRDVSHWVRVGEPDSV